MNKLMELQAAQKLTTQTILLDCVFKSVRWLRIDMEITLLGNVWCNVLEEALTLFLITLP